MKILNSTVLLTIAVFMQFGELNSSGLKRGFTSRTTPTLVHNLPAGPDTEGPSHRSIPYGDRIIELWLDATETRVVKADYFGNYEPSPSYIVSCDFFVKLIDVGLWKVVGYLRTNESFIGVRAPNPNARRYDLEPSRTRWFIIYFGRAFKVTVYSATGRPRGISLVPQNLHKKTEYQTGIQTTNVSLGNVHFIIFHGPKGILGAQLNPEYHRPGLKAD